MITPKPTNIRTFMPSKKGWVNISNIPHLDRPADLLGTLGLHLDVILYADLGN